jgi:lysozyme
MRLSDQGLQLLKKLENPNGQPPFKPYWDKRQWSIAYGSFAGSYDKAKKPPLSLNQQQADAMLRKQLMDYEAFANQKIKVPLSQYQFDGVILFTYNLGNGILVKASKTYPTTLLQDINNNNFSQFSTRMLRYNKSLNSKQVLVEDPGLVARRKVEYAWVTNALQFVKDHGVSMGMGVIALIAGFFF